MAIAAAAGIPGLVAGGDFEAALDLSGGRIEFPGLPGMLGWCFGALVGDRLVGVVYACTPVDFVLSHRGEQRAWLARSVVEIEIVAVEEGFRGSGAGTALLRHVERFLGERGVEVFVAKVDASDMPVMRWYRHRGYRVADAGESCLLVTASGATSIDAGPAHARRWRLAIKAPGKAVVRGLRGLRLEPISPA
ncbi:GNAT family N-acetyltransferase [Amycolatopsis alba]|uniref:GNAT family N-acetyltransferase n=1 Tax=Amycolatopsis alba DSM 44262 TaxID=1125972 RepID=A0A229RDS2_AMYAL|nr:GNAT family N-acetyltransferase [Amycolatopsis alba]OXM44787.1 GNAT family N-acetyltransferase [Amycolatopsis alba DSM 44262]